jgi:tungstate transport system permease protein
MTDINAILPIVLLSFYISGTATIIGTMLGVPLGTFLGLKKFRGKRVFKTIVFTLYGFPPVVMGLFIFLLLSASGPLGFARQLFTPTAMILAETLLVLPLVVGITMSSVGAVDKNTSDTIYSLGASKGQALLLHLKEAKNGIYTAVMVGFGAAISEVGAAMMVGGNIAGETRVLTTAVVLETRMGNFDTAILLGVILLAVSAFVYFLLVMLGEHGDE